jgi:hypothetical protein
VVARPPNLCRQPSTAITQGLDRCRK